MIKNFNVESTYKKMILDSKSPVLNPATGKTLIIKSVNRVPKKSESKSKILIKRGGVESDKR